MASSVRERLRKEREAEERAIRRRYGHDPFKYHGERIRRADARMPAPIRAMLYGGRDPYAGGKLDGVWLGTVQPAVVHGRRDGLIDVQLHDMRSIPGRVFWSRSGNAYVLAEGDENYLSSMWRLPDGRVVALLSVNGIGEVRWPVWPSKSPSPAYDDAVKFFGLVPAA